MALAVSVGERKRFLISRLSALGDVICCLPAASALKDAFPDCEVTWIVDPRFADIVNACRAVDKLIKIRPSFSPSTWLKPGIDFDAAFDLQGLLKSAVALRGLKCPRFGYHWQREGASFFSHPVLPDLSSHHIVDQYVDVVRAYTSRECETSFNVVADAESVATISAKLNTVGPFVVINPGAAWVSKRWPASSFGEVIRWLTDRGVATVLIGGKGDLDRESSAGVLSAAGEGQQILDLTGQTSIAELIALVSLSQAHLGGDTGSSHLAAALGIPAIGLYSITRPQRSCPYRQMQRCLYDPESLHNIKSGSVIEKLETVL